MDLTALSGRSYGPHPLHISVDGVADFVDVTGDHSGRWVDAAPPGFAAAALFVVAPELLDQLSDRAIIHGEQSFTWHQGIEIGSLLQVRGEVSRIRQRGGVYFVTFDLEAGADRTVLEGSSLFVVSGESVPGPAEFERPEPPQAYRGAPEEDQLSASRADLIRYAAATRDWNPIHWDHDSAVAAGFPGVVVHGLMQASWAFAAVTRQVGGNYPLASARVRFRHPLLPARPVNIVVTSEDSSRHVRIADDEHEYATATIEATSE